MSGRCGCWSVRDWVNGTHKWLLLLLLLLFGGVPPAAALLQMVHWGARGATTLGRLLCPCTVHAAPLVATYIGVGPYGVPIPSITGSDYPRPKPGQQLYSILSFSWEVRERNRCCFVLLPVLSATTPAFAAAHRPAPLLVVVAASMAACCLPAHAAPPRLTPSRAHPPFTLQGKSNRGTGKFGDDWNSKLSPQEIQASRAQDSGRMWMMR